MSFNKYKGHIMIEVLLSLCIVGIIVTTLLPNLTSLIENHRRTNETNQLINYVQSNFETIISNNYHKGSVCLNVENNKYYDIEVDNTKVGNLNKVVIYGKDKRYYKEIQFEIYLWDEGLFTN